MNSALVSDFEPLFLERMSETCRLHPDPSHDLLHVNRVVAMAKRLAILEGARLEVVVPAAYLHDVVAIAKDDSRRSQASRLSAQAAVEFLEAIAYPQEFSADIAHAIEAHSFSAGVPARTLEARIVQDADRLDAMGAIGIARCFAMSGMLGRPFYAEIDPFCEERPVDDRAHTVDHFYAKLLKLTERLNTPTAREEGTRRTALLSQFLDQLRTEL